MFHFLNKTFIVANQMFESIGSLKYPMVQFSNRSTYKFFSANFKQVQKALFFGDSNNQDLILTYDFFKDAWSKRDVKDPYFIAFIGAC